MEKVVVVRGWVRYIAQGGDGVRATVRTKVLRGVEPRGKADWVV
jgi:hypothetical protein